MRLGRDPSMLLVRHRYELDGNPGSICLVKSELGLGSLNNKILFIIRQESSLHYMLLSLQTKHVGLN
jgi:hypothetical protein